MVIRGVTFYIDKLPVEIKFLFEDFRLAVNKAIRVGLQSGITSRYTLSKLAYKDLRSEHQIYSRKGRLFRDLRYPATALSQEKKAPDEKGS